MCELYYVAYEEVGVDERVHSRWLRGASTGGLELGLNPGDRLCDHTQEEVKIAQLEPRFPHIICLHRMRLRDLLERHPLRHWPQAKRVHLRIAPSEQIDLSAAQLVHQ